MTDYRRVSQADPQAATVHIFGDNDAPMARITWPSRDGSRSFIMPSVGRELLPAVAIGLATEALALETVEQVVVLVEDETIWSDAWGRLT